MILKICIILVILQLLSSIIILYVKRIKTKHKTKCKKLKISRKRINTFGNTIMTNDQLFSSDHDNAVLTKVINQKTSEVISLIPSPSSNDSLTIISKKEKKEKRKDRKKAKLAKLLREKTKIKVKAQKIAKEKIIKEKKRTKPIEKHDDIVEETLQKSKVFKSAHIPIRVCLKLALKNIWKKKFRFLVVIIICCISLAFLSFTIELHGDKLRQNVYTMIENNYNYTDIKKSTPIKSNNNFYDKYESGELDKNSYTTIKEKLPELMVHKYENIDYHYAINDDDISTEFFTGHVTTLIEYDKTNSYTLLAGRLPHESAKEILITDYLVEAFNYFNTFFESGTIYDYLNKYIDLNVQDDYQIVGIVKTNFSNWYSYTGFQNTNIDYTDKRNYAFYNDLKMMNAIIITAPYFEIEKIDVSGNLTFTGSTENKSTWLVNISSDKLLKNYRPNQLTFRQDKLSIFYRSTHRWDQTPYGRTPNNDDEIAIPISWVNDIFDFNPASDGYDEWRNNILNTNITIALTPSHQNSSFSKTFKVVGIVNSDDKLLVSQNIYKTLEKYTQENEKIMTELPKDKGTAYRLFKKAYKHGYILNVWEYQTDIDSYTVDPFIDIISKAGLVVFVAFTIGIMWTIITIEIVDSKKEIGILRSIGLSGIKVSIIFIIQALFVTLIAYGISIILANYVINIYNSSITDELNLIPLYMYTLTYRTPLFLIIFVLIIAFVSTCIPLYKIMSQKIIDVINERE